jgi:hypothetical protein
VKHCSLFWELICGGCRKSCPFNPWGLTSWSWFIFLTVTVGLASSGSSSSNRGSIPRDPSILILPTDNFGENEVRELVSLGFTREQVKICDSNSDWGVKVMYVLLKLTCIVFILEVWLKMKSGLLSGLCLSLLSSIDLIFNQLYILFCT